MESQQCCECIENGLPAILSTSKMESQECWVHRKMNPGHPDDIEKGFAMLIYFLVVEDQKFEVKLGIGWLLFIRKTVCQCPNLPRARPPPWTSQKLVLGRLSMMIFLQRLLKLPWPSLHGTWKWTLCYGWFPTFCDGSNSWGVSIPWLECMRIVFWISYSELTEWDLTTIPETAYPPHLLVSVFFWPLVLLSAVALPHSSQWHRWRQSIEDGIVHEIPWLNKGWSGIAHLMPR